MSEELRRFVAAQDPVLDVIHDELRTGRKESHWMWFVFPQLAALGQSSTAKYYGLSDSSEAHAYAQDPTLGPRLRCCFRILLALPSELSAADIFGGTDASKLRSCATLFADVPGWPEARAVIDRFYGGHPDQRTMRLVAAREAGAGSA